MLNTLAGCAVFSSLLIAVGLTARWFLLRYRYARGAKLVAAVALVASLPTTALAAYLTWCWAAGQPTATTQVLAQGVDYERRVLTSPRPAVVHIVRIDLDRGHTLVVSAADVSTPDGLRCAALTTTAALDDLEADLMVNASFFRPFRDEWFLDYRPKRGDPVEVVGASISDGTRYGREAADWPSLCVQHDGGVYLGTPDDQTRHAVSGNRWLLQNDRASEDEPDTDRPYARTAVGINADRTQLWLVVVDGKQPRYSEGMTRAELAGLFQSLGASDAINLDGGGSSTLAARIEGQARLLNRPCHTKIPRRERPVANHLGVVYRSNP